ncbi:MAG: CoA transferase subunit A [Proteobacteria bacterium]|nr:CoA transferase subunit A [Pseudomonadota bacterium]
MPVTDKVCTLTEAVSRLIGDGDAVALGLALEGNIPFAVGHEMIRQGRRDLTLIGPISDILFDQLVGAGIVSKIIAAWVGNVSTGIGYNFRRAVETGLPGPVTVHDMSNYTAALGLWAAAQGLPFAPCASLLGTDVIRDNPQFGEVECPFTGRRLLAVKAIRPDVAVIHVMRADRAGNAHVWGATGVALDAVRAAKRVLVTAEEIVDEAVIRSDPDRTKVPGFLVDAVCEVPFGAHPSAVQGYYNHDDDFYVEYARATRDPAGAEAWLDEFVLGVKDRVEYVERVGRERVEALRIRHSLPTTPADFGY